MAADAPPVTSFLVEQVSGSPRVGWSRWRDQGDGSPMLPAAAHPGVEITWAVRGAVEYRMSSQTVTAGPDAIVIVPEGVDHRTRIMPRTVAVSLKVDAALVGEVLDDLGKRRLEPGTLPRTPVVGGIGSVLADRKRLGDRGLAASVDDLASALVRRLVKPEEATRCGRADPRLRRAVELIESRLGEPLEIDDLARAAGMSRFHFGRSFRAALGASPYQWLLQRRVERAAALLRSGRWSVTDAAFEVGFSDLSRFAQAFRRHLGCPPSAFASAA